MAAEIVFGNGGRPYNGRDFAVLQELVNTNNEIFKTFVGDYIISGCQNRGDAGSVWLGNKVRSVTASITITPSTPFPLWVVAQNQTIYRLYKDGVSKPAFNQYTAIWTDQVPVTGSTFIQFNSAADLNNIRLSQKLIVDAVPTSGGTFTGDIVVMDTVRTISAFGSPIGTTIFGSTGADGNNNTGIGFNTTWNGSNYLNHGDGTSNAGGGVVMQYSNGVTPVMNFFLNASAGGADRLLTANDINNNTRMSLNHLGDLNIRRNLIVTGDAVLGSITTPTLNMNKTVISTGRGISRIVFTGTFGDPGFIEHEENNNVSQMRFCVSDDATEQDWFSFGAQPGGNFSETVRIYANGRATFNSTITANDFIIPSDERLKTNFNELVDGVKVIERLRPLEFDLIQDGTHKVGFIAQEVQDVIPHAVIMPKNDDDFFSLKETQVIPYLVRAIQELSNDVKVLKAKNVALEKQIIDLTLKNNDIR